MVTVERVLPWRRERRQTEDQIAPLIIRFQGPGREHQVDVVSRAYRMAAKAHSGQRRKSGEPYIVHPLEVARIVASLGLDEVTVASALLHDAVEDTRIELDDIQRAFGGEVATIVDGVTKLDRLRFDSREAAQAASFRKMLVAMAKDIRVLIIKLCDRLHNLRTIAALPAWKQERTANETLDVYAPLAHRLGMQDLKMQLEDLSFAALHPKRYAEIEHMAAIRAPERDLLPNPGPRGGAFSDRRARHRGGCHRPRQAPLFDLREDDVAGQGVRRSQRPCRDSGHRRNRA